MFNNLIIANIILICSLRHTKLLAVQLFFPIICIYNNYNTQRSLTIIIRFIENYYEFIFHSRFKVNEIFMYQASHKINMFNNSIIVNIILVWLLRHTKLLTVQLFFPIICIYNNYNTQLTINYDDYIY